MIDGIRTNLASVNAGYKEEEKKAMIRKNKDIQEVANQNKAAQIKESIENRDYKIDLQKTSEKMALDLLNL